MFTFTTSTILLVAGLGAKLVAYVAHWITLTSITAVRRTALLQGKDSNCEPNIVGVIKDYRIHILLPGLAICLLFVNLIEPAFLASLEIVSSSKSYSGLAVVPTSTQSNAVASPRLPIASAAMLTTNVSYASALIVFYSDWLSNKYVIPGFSGETVIGFTDSSRYSEAPSIYGVMYYGSDFYMYHDGCSALCAGPYEEDTLVNVTRDGSNDLFEVEPGNFRVKSVTCPLAGGFDYCTIVSNGPTFFAALGAFIGDSTWATFNNDTNTLMLGRYEIDVWDVGGLHQDETLQLTIDDTVPCPLISQEVMSRGWIMVDDWGMRNEQCNVFGKFECRTRSDQVGYGCRPAPRTVVVFIESTIEGYSTDVSLSVYDNVGSIDLARQRVSEMLVSSFTHATTIKSSYRISEPVVRPSVWTGITVVAIVSLFGIVFLVQCFQSEEPSIPRSMADAAIFQERCMLGRGSRLGVDGKVRNFKARQIDGDWYVELCPGTYTRTDVAPLKKDDHEDLDLQIALKEGDDPVEPIALKEGDDPVEPIAL